VFVNYLLEKIYTPLFIIFSAETLRLARAVYIISPSGWLPPGMAARDNDRITAARTRRRDHPVRAADSVRKLNRK
jgi:hypothetical protein